MTGTDYLLSKGSKMGGWKELILILMYFSVNSKIT